MGDVDKDKDKDKDKDAKKKGSKKKANAKLVNKTKAKNAKPKLDPDTFADTDVVDSDTPEPIEADPRPADLQRYVETLKTRSLR